MLFSIETKSLINNDEGDNNKDGMEHKDFQIQVI